MISSSSSRCRCSCSACGPAGGTTAMLVTAQMHRRAAQVFLCEILRVVSPFSCVPMARPRHVQAYKGVAAGSCHC
jgi:hypothetical protein